MTHSDAARRALMAQGRAYLEQRAREQGILPPVEPLQRDDDGHSILPSPRTLAAQQVEEAEALLDRDVSNCLRWSFRHLDALVGQMMPGDFVVVGGLPGGGKSSLLLSQIDAMDAAKQPVLYLPLEVPPKVCRLRWAAWKLNLDVRHVIRQEWGKLPKGSLELVRALLREQREDSVIHFVPTARPDIDTLRRWVRWGVSHAGARAIVIDHLHRLDVLPTAGGGDYRVGLTETVRELVDLGRSLGLVVIGSAHLNRDRDPLDALRPAQMARLKETAAIAEEADVGLMLSKALKPDDQLPEKWERELKLGRINESQLAVPGVMCATCRKHRLDNFAVDKTVRLQVVNGRVEDLLSQWEKDADARAARQREMELEEIGA